MGEQGVREGLGEVEGIEGCHDRINQTWDLLGAATPGGEERAEAEHGGSLGKPNQMIDTILL